MGDVRIEGNDDAVRGVRARRPARRGSDADPRPVPVAAIFPAPPKVVLYHADGCHLCAAAQRVVEAVRDELGFELEQVDIAGDPVLERRYRELLPVVEIDGERAFTYFVQPDALRRKVAQAQASGGTL